MDTPIWRNRGHNRDPTNHRRRRPCRAFRPCRQRETHQSQSVSTSEEHFCPMKLGKRATGPPTDCIMSLHHVTLAARATISNKRTPIPAPPPPSSSTTTIGANDQQQHHQPPSSATPSSSSNTTTVTKAAGSFLGRFESLFRPIGELPAPEPFMNKPKSYPSQRVQSAKQQQPATTATSHS